MSEPIFKNESPEAQLAQKLLEEKFQKSYAKVPDGWIFGIDLETKRTFLAKSIIDLTLAAKPNERVVTVAMKVKGRDKWPWMIHRLDPRAYRLLEEFQAGRCTAFSIARKNVRAFQPGLFRKMSDTTQGIIISDAAEKLREFAGLNDAGIEIRELSLSDVEPYLKTRQCVLVAVV